MAEVFISYARGRADDAERAAQALRGLGYEVWRDDQLPVHRAFSEVIEERLGKADAVLVLWSADAARSDWVRAEAEVARQAGKLAQAALDGALPPLPFNQIQCADLKGWAGDPEFAGWRKVVASLAALTDGRSAAEPASSPVASPVADDKPSIAVLPLHNVTGGREEECFADGMVDEIVGALSRFPTLKTIGSRSSLSYRGDPRPAKAIADELGVRFLLSGSVRRSGERVRASVDLTDVQDGGGRQVWRQRFDGQVEDVFDLEAQIARSAAAQIVPAIEGAYRGRALARPTNDLSAYELYLRAVYREREFTARAFEDGIAALDLAIARDPGFAQALGYCSLMHSLMVLNGWADNATESARVALDLGQRALATGVDDADVLSMVATVLIWVGDDAAAADALVERALALNPGGALPWFASAWIKLFAGRHALAVQQWEQHLSLDPRSSLYAFVAGGLGIAFTLERNFAEGAARLTEALRHVPDHRPFRTFQAAALAHAGRLPEARQALAAAPADAVENALGLLRDPEDRALVGCGLALANNG